MSSRFRSIFIAGLLAVITVCIALSWSTRDSLVHLPFLRGHNTSASSSGGGDPKSVVDLEPWDTAQALAGLAGSAEEAAFARQAEHLADHEVDQAFASALREATLDRHALTGNALALAQKVLQMQAVVEYDQSRIHELEAHDPENDLDVAKAQLGLDQDQLKEVQEDLTRAGGDQRGRIQEELATHEAAMHKYDAELSAQSPLAIHAAEARATVAANLSAWSAQQTRHDLLQAAAQRARANAASLTAAHDKVEHTVPEAVAAGDRNKASRLAALDAQATRSQLLGIYTDRIEAQKQLAETYDKWAEQVVLEHRMTGHFLLLSVALIAFILLCAVFLRDFAMRVAQRPALDQRRMQTLATVLKRVVEFTCALLIVLVIFGRPGQLSTILGLATAGLTVALQDFIVAFCGWFVLMGRNGIRLGDWVEINGVAGEIVHIGLFRTSMLETGNSIDKGRPTGRRIAFINSFAIKGQYFNFSTSGQWMWDEIRVSIPADRDAYSTIEQVREAVMRQTAKDAQQAELEWKRVSRHFATEPAVDMRPGSTGIDIVVRYVTRAGDRFEVRNRLYQEILGLLHQPAC